MSAAAFSERVGVQRSSVSHILSKRNKPSLEFILKINNSFNEITLDWLLLQDSEKELTPPPYIDDKRKRIITDSDSESLIISNNDENFDGLNEVTEIIKFYKDGSFKTFLPRT